MQDLRSVVRERLDVKRNIRQHFLPVAGVIGLAGLILGYSTTGMLVRD